jgi:4'-phosphopantetheinyl transferase
VELVDKELIVVVQRLRLDQEQQHGAARVAGMRAHAMAALGAAARARGAQLGQLKKDERDAPLPSSGWHWSLSHTSQGELGLVVASVSRSPVGVDAEAVRLAGPDVVASAMNVSERALFADMESAQAFTRCWVAKEAVLKKLGLGLMALSRVRLEDVDGNACVLALDGAHHAVELHSFPPFLAGVAGRASERVEWRGDDTLGGQVHG